MFRLAYPLVHLERSERPEAIEAQVTLMMNDFVVRLAAATADSEPLASFG